MSAAQPAVEATETGGFHLAADRDWRSWSLGLLVLCAISSVVTPSALAAPLRAAVATFTAAVAPVVGAEPQEVVALPPAPQPVREPAVTSAPLRPSVPVPVRPAPRPQPSPQPMSAPTPPPTAVPSPTPEPTSSPPPSPPQVAQPPPPAEGDSLLAQLAKEIPPPPNVPVPALPPGTDPALAALAPAMATVCQLAAQPGGLAAAVASTGDATIPGLSTFVGVLLLYGEPIDQLCIAFGHPEVVVTCDADEEADEVAPPPVDPPDAVGGGVGTAAGVEHEATGGTAASDGVAAPLGCETTDATP